MICPICGRWVTVPLLTSLLKTHFPDSIFESVFKSFARALDEAKSIDGRVTGVPSTKGKL